MTNRSRVLRNLFLLSIFFLPIIAKGQWRPDSTRNTPVCDTSGMQDMPKACTDGNDGAIIAWEDNRSGVYQIYAQHVDEFGRMRWMHNGVRLANVPNAAQTMPAIATDGNGGAYVLWLDARNNATYGTSIYAQHILADGALAYTDTGLPLGIGLNNCANPALCDDGYGGAFAAWEDNRTAVTTSRPDIWGNRLWPNGVKYGLDFTGSGSHYHFHFGMTTIDYWHDGNAHYRSYLNGLNIIINGQSYKISKVVNDTELNLSAYPTSGITYSYYIPTLCGFPLDTMNNKQSSPVLIHDGTGGAYLLWVTSVTSPNSIYGTRLDSGCNALWDWEPQPGFKFFQSPNVSNQAKAVSLTLDSNNQLLLAVQMFSSTANSMQVEVLRMKAGDSTSIWGNAFEVTGDVPLDKTNPKIFSDDSSVDANGDRGVLVPFVDAVQGANGPDDHDIAMVRLLGTGGDLIPPVQTSYWFLDQKNHAQNGLKAVKISDPINPTHNGVLAIWTDAWDGTDSMLYAQRMDRNGRKYFPTPGTSSGWGKAISGNSPTKQWSARQPTVVARNDGAIVAWTDFRGGTTGDIYAQLITMDGNLWIPFDTTNPTLAVTSTTPPDNGQACNSQCTTIQATDPGFKTSGIDSVFLINSSNMELQPPTFAKGAASASFTVCVADSFQNGTATVGVFDTLLNEQTMTLNYCTVADTNTPVITWDTIGLTLPNWLNIHVRDNAPWSRGLSSVTLPSHMNITKQSAYVAPGSLSYDTTITIRADTQFASFTIKGTGASGTSASASFTYNPPNESVSQQNPTPASLSIYPNPTLGSTLIRVDGVPEAQVSISDILGRTIDSFELRGTHEWDPGMLIPGTYIVRAVIGDVILSKTIVKQ